MTSKKVVVPVSSIALVAFLVWFFMTFLKQDD